MGVTLKQIEDLIERQKTNFLKDYKRIVESPSISAFSEHHKDVRKTAEIAIELIRASGGEAKLYETDGHPVVFGRIENDPNAQTIAIYNHLDVQPAEKGKDGWTREPFTFTEDKGRFYSRGTTDDKGPAMAALWGARMAKELGVPTNIEFIWELEEEIGSPNFHQFLAKAKDEIRASAIVVSDTIWIGPEQPCITRGLRGMLQSTLRLKTGTKETHSGTTGGPARNPITELCSIIGSCVDGRTGEIKIEGFAETWAKPDQALLQKVNGTGFTAEAFQKAHGFLKLRVTNPTEIAARIWAMPTMEIHGITGGYQGPGVKTIVPPEAEAKVSFRLVGEQDPDHIFSLFEKHVHHMNPDCEVFKEAILRPYSAPTGLEQTKAVEDALEFAYGKKPIEVMEGGSIGAIVTMDEMLDAPVLFMGLSLPEDGYHGPDESFAWDQLAGGAKAYVRLLENLAGPK